MATPAPMHCAIAAPMAVGVICFLLGGCDTKPKDAVPPSLGLRAQTDDEVESRVKKIVGDLLDVDAGKLKSSDRFVADLGADDLDAAELVMEFEDVFDLSISDEAAEKMVTIKDAVVYISKHRKKH